MSSLPICDCATFWPKDGHHPDCPVRREIERLRVLLVAALTGLEFQNVDFWLTQSPDVIRVCCEAVARQAKRAADQPAAVPASDDPYLPGEEFKRAVLECAGDTWECPRCGHSEPWWTDTNADVLSRRSAADKPADQPSASPCGCAETTDGLGNRGKLWCGKHWAERAASNSPVRHREPHPTFGGEPFPPHAFIPCNPAIADPTICHECGAGAEHPIHSPASQEPDA